MNSGATEGLSVPAPLVKPIMLLLLYAAGMLLHGNGKFKLGKLKSSNNVVGVSFTDEGNK